MNNINNTTFALILTVENKKSINNINNNSLEERDFEKESIRCIKNWRLNGGWLKNIPIYIHCPSFELSKETTQHYNDYNAVLLYNYIEDIYKYDYGFINVHYSGKYFSSILKEDILIHIDLDMELLRPLSIDFFDPILNNNFEVMVGGYSNIDYKNQRKPLFGKVLLNTDIIISKNIFSNTLYNTIINCCDFINNNQDILKSNNLFRIYDIEEYGADLAYTLLYDNIFILHDYEQGEGYYDNNLKNIPYFWHEHITTKLNTELFLQKRKILSYINSNNI